MSLVTPDKILADPRNSRIYDAVWYLLPEKLKFITQNLEDKLKEDRRKQFLLKLEKKAVEKGKTIGFKGPLKKYFQYNEDIIGCLNRLNGKEIIAIPGTSPDNTSRLSGIVGKVSVDPICNRFSITNAIIKTTKRLHIQNPENIIYVPIAPFFFPVHVKKDGLLHYVYEDIIRSVGLPGALTKGNDLGARKKGMYQFSEKLFDSEKAIRFYKSEESWGDLSLEEQKEKQKEMRNSTQFCRYLVYQMYNNIFSQIDIDINKFHAYMLRDGWAHGLISKVHQNILDKISENEEFMFKFKEGRRESNETTLERLRTNFDFKGLGDINSNKRELGRKALKKLNSYLYNKHAQKDLVERRKIKKREKEEKILLKSNCQKHPKTSMIKCEYQHPCEEGAELGYCAARFILDNSLVNVELRKKFFQDIEETPYSISSGIEQDIINLNIGDGWVSEYNEENEKEELKGSWAEWTLDKLLMPYVIPNPPIVWQNQIRGSEFGTKCDIHRIIAKMDKEQFGIESNKYAQSGTFRHFINNTDPDGKHLIHYETLLLLNKIKEVKGIQDEKDTLLTLRKEYCEKTTQLRINRFVVKGSYDCLCRLGKKSIAILDYKRANYDKISYRQQLFLYASGIERAVREDMEKSLETGEVPKHIIELFTKEERENITESIEKRLSEGIFENYFVIRIKRSRQKEKTKDPDYIINLIKPKGKFQQQIHQETIRTGSMQEQLVADAGMFNQYRERCQIEGHCHDENRTVPECFGKETCDIIHKAINKGEDIKKFLLEGVKIR